MTCELRECRRSEATGSPSGDVLCNATLSADLSFVSGRAGGYGGPDRFKLDPSKKSFGFTINTTGKRCGTLQQQHRGQER